MEFKFIQYFSKNLLPISLINNVSLGDIQIYAALFPKKL